MPDILLAVGPVTPVDRLRARLLDHPGTAIVEAYDVATATRLARDEHFDAAVVDVDLGAPALRRLAGLLHDRARIVVVPGHPWTPTPDTVEAIAGIVLGPRRPAPARLAAGDIALDRATREGWRGRRRLHLTPRTYRLLEVFLEHPGAVLSSDRLFATVWGGWQLSNVLYVYVRYLRAILEAGGEPRVITTVRGIGYRLDVDPRLAPG
jgi:DNA-binding response OmpR family regulator